MSEGKGKRDGEERLAREISRLPLDIPPDRDLWPGIAARLDERRHPEMAPRWRLAGAMAAAAALVAISSLATLWIVSKEEPAVVSRVQPPSGLVQPAAMPASFGPDYTLGPRYEKARRQLSRDLQERLGTLSPETREVVQKNLAQIRQAMAEINAALAADPGNMLLQQLLMAAYQDEMTVLMDVNRMAQSLPTRKEI